MATTKNKTKTRAKSPKASPRSGKTTGTGKKAAKKTARRSAGEGAGRLSKADKDMSGRKPGTNERRRPTKEAAPARGDRKQQRKSAQGEDVATSRSPVNRTAKDLTAVRR